MSLDLTLPEIAAMLRLTRDTFIPDDLYDAARSARAKMEVAFNNGHAIPWARKRSKKGRK